MFLKSSILMILNYWGPRCWLGERVIVLDYQWSSHVTLANCIAYCIAFCIAYWIAFVLPIGLHIGLPIVLPIGFQWSTTHLEIWKPGSCVNSICHSSWKPGSFVKVTWSRNVTFIYYILHCNGGNFLKFNNRNTLLRSLQSSKLLHLQCCYCSRKATGAVSSAVVPQQAWKLPHLQCCYCRGQAPGTLCSAAVSQQAWKLPHLQCCFCWGSAPWTERSAVVP